ncbi:SURF1 family protein [Pseudomonas saliphila]|uniref:SURF1 family protein n=1 Tax=Pseudomonas saliphila TaxID=2586906 RepID=UPI001F3799C3|nr:SURF1 family protein [Pseudomonas saliphila]
MSAAVMPARFRPGWLLSLWVLAFMPLLLGLGWWQLERAEEKRSMQALIDQAGSAVPVTLDQAIGLPDPAWRPVHLQGSFDAQHVWLLDNRIREGRAGVEVLQAFNDRASREQILVNRGWLAWPDRRIAPAIDTPQGEQRLDAQIVAPSESGFSLGNESASDSWPRLISSIELQSMANQAGIELLPHVARLRSGSPAAFTLDWPALPMTASKHTGYAVQWFALALALLILFIWAGLRPEPDGDARP